VYTNVAGNPHCPNCMSLAPAALAVPLGSTTTHISNFILDPGAKQPSRSTDASITPLRMFEVDSQIPRETTRLLIVRKRIRRGNYSTAGLPSASYLLSPLPATTTSTRPRLFSFTTSSLVSGFSCETSDAVTAIPVTVGATASVGTSFLPAAGRGHGHRYRAAAFLRAVCSKTSSSGFSSSSNHTTSGPRPPTSFLVPPYFKAGPPQTSSVVSTKKFGVLRQRPGHSLLALATVSHCFATCSCTAASVRRQHLQQQYVCKRPRVARRSSSPQVTPRCPLRDGDPERQTFALSAAGGITGK